MKFRLFFAVSVVKIRPRNLWKLFCPGSRNRVADWLTNWLIDWFNRVVVCYSVSDREKRNSSSSDVVEAARDANPVRQRLMHMLGLTVPPRTASAATQTAANSLRSAGTQTEHASTSSVTASASSSSYRVTRYQWPSVAGGPRGWWSPDVCGSLPPRFLVYNTLPACIVVSNTHGVIHHDCTDDLVQSVTIISVETSSWRHYAVGMH